MLLVVVVAVVIVVEVVVLVIVVVEVVVVVVAIWRFCELENFSPRTTAPRSFIIIRTTVAGHYYFVHGE